MARNTCKGGTDYDVTMGYIPEGQVVIHLPDYSVRKEFEH